MTEHPVRLFTALWPPRAVVDALEDAAALTGVVRGSGWRPVPSARWHLTLAFHGDDLPGPRIHALDRLAGCPAPRLRLAGTGTFPGVLWAGLETAGPDDLTALERLVAATGADPDGFVGHLTLARATRRRSGRGGAGPSSSRPVRGGRRPRCSWWSANGPTTACATGRCTASRWPPIPMSPTSPVSPVPRREPEPRRPGTPLPTARMPPSCR